AEHRVDLQSVGLTGERRQRVVGAEDVGRAVDQEDMVTLPGCTGGNGGRGGLGFWCWHDGQCGPSSACWQRSGGNLGYAGDYRTGCSASLPLDASLGASLGASQNSAGRSNRKVRRIARAAQNIISAPRTPANVTSAEMVPTSEIQPVLISTARLAAIGR